MSGPSIDTQIAAVKTALAFASSATERALLKAAIATLERVRREEAAQREHAKALTDVVRAFGRLE